MCLPWDKTNPEGNIAAQDPWVPTLCCCKRRTLFNRGVRAQAKLTTSLPLLMLSLICITFYPGLFSSFIWLWELGLDVQEIIPAWANLFIPERGLCRERSGLAPAVPPADGALRKTCFSSLHVSHTGQQQSNSPARNYSESTREEFRQGRGYNGSFLSIIKHSFFFSPSLFVNVSWIHRIIAIFKLSLTVAGTTEAPSLRALDLLGGYTHRGTVSYSWAQLGVESRWLLVSTLENKIGVF